MNIQLEKLFETYRISSKEKYEMYQIFSFLPSDKQQSILENFEKLANQFQIIREDIQKEQSVFVEQSLSHIEKVMLQVKQQR